LRYFVGDDLRDGILNRQNTLSHIFPKVYYIGIFKLLVEKLSQNNTS